MIILPDIEIQEGQSVNRIRGMEDEPRVYDVSPLDAAVAFAAAGAEWLHVVDVDASLHRQPDNAGLIRHIIDSVDVPVQVAGGIRTFCEVERWVDHGAARVVLGTAAVTDRHLLMEVCAHFPGQVVVSITGRGGYAVIDGWRTRTSFKVPDLALSLERIGAAAIIYTDLDRLEEGSEVGLASTIDLAARLEIPLIASGTAQTLEDVSTMSLLPNIEGAIVGRALFEGAFTLPEAIGIACSATVTTEIESRGMRPRLDPAPEVPLTRIDRVGIRVTDIERSARFYRSLGFVEENREEWSRAGGIVMRHPCGVGIVLMRGDAAAGPSGASLVLEVSSLSRTRKAVEHNKLHSRSSGSPDGAFYIKDPDENIIALDSDRRRPVV